MKFESLQLASIANLSPSNHINFPFDFASVIHHIDGNAATAIQSRHQKEYVELYPLPAKSRSALYLNYFYPLWPPDI